MEFPRPESGASIRVAIDIGGGFVDLVAVDEQTGAMSWSKAGTTPHDLRECVREVFRRSGVEPTRVSQLLHGQTLVINAILQRKGARVGLITTRGFRDILELQRSNRRDIFNLQYRKPEPFVPRDRRVETEERTLADGRVLKEVDEKDLAAGYRRLREKNVESLAICFINSYANPENEARARELIQKWQAREAEPIRYLSISSDVCREWREYERTSTCVLNAYVMPLVDQYLCTLERDFRTLGVKGTLYIMLAEGGVASFAYAVERPIETVESGPVAGVVGALALAELLGAQNFISMDGGSTTTKASLVEGRRIRFTRDYAVERDAFRPGYPIRVPVVDIQEIGSGGGSIAWLDEMGKLKVGPVNAGAYPGPACYGFGGERPTLTDAYLVAGFLNPDYFLGGTMKLHTRLAEEALEPVARHFGISIEAAAQAVVRIANDNSAQLLRLISVQRGYDPRDFTLIAYGGSGPMIAPFIAEELEIPRVLIPVIPPGNFSAWGLLMSDLRHTVLQTLVQRLDAKGSAALLSDTFQKLESEISDLYAAEGITEGVRFQRTADLRYYGQEHTITIPVPSGRYGEGDMVQMAETFAQYHEREYGFRLASAVELVNLRVTGTRAVWKPVPKRRIGQRTVERVAPVAERKVHWANGPTLHTPVYRRQDLPLQATIRGPGIIEEPTTTIIVPPGYVASVDDFGNLLLEREHGRRD